MKSAYELIPAKKENVQKIIFTRTTKKFALKSDLFSNVSKMPSKRKSKKVIYIDLGLILTME